MQNVTRGLKWVSHFFNRGIFLITLVGIGEIVFLPHAYSATPANTLIENFATVDFTMNSVSESVVSNTTSFRVDEIISFSLVSNNPSGVLVQSPESNAVLSYTLSNQGNGDESFSISISQSVSDDFDPSTSAIYLDSNGNGIYDDGVDTLYSPTVNDPLVAMNDTLVLFVLSSIQASLNPADESEINLTATSKTGAGPSGTAYNGQGDGGVDALMGLQGGAITALGKFIVGSASASLVKSQSILDPNGDNFPIQNAIITYTLELNVTGSGNLTSVNLSDLIPVGTTYVANSIRLNTLPLTDAADADAGVFNGTSVLVALDTVTAPTTHTVTFQVRID